ncbi:hypothetical protein TRIP_C60007 [Candidatus Zixiibacteriota bacterium]|nr:hypothetical protein TRIP_C60007 [candidate division Zixibacteria bacterium]
MTFDTNSLFYRKVIGLSLRDV